MNEAEHLAAEEALRQEFNRWADDGRGEGMAAEHANIADGLLARMTFGERDKVLDIGCGSGWFVARLAELVPGGQVIGIDVADAMIHLARSTYRDAANVMFMSGAAEEIPWDECFFEKVVSIESAYYWPDPARGLAEAFRVLRPGGTVWILINLFEENESSHGWQDKLAVRTHLLSGEEWCERLRSTGFENVAHDLVPDTRSVAEDNQSTWFEDVDARRRFLETGALLVTGTRPELK